MSSTTPTPQTLPPQQHFPITPQKQIKAFDDAFGLEAAFASGTELFHDNIFDHESSYPLCRTLTSGKACNISKKTNMKRGLIFKYINTWNSRSLRRI